MTDFNHERKSALISVVHRLRQVREARKRFLMLWALQNQEAPPGGQGQGPALDAPGDHDWSLLYRGSVLDD